MLNTHIATSDCVKPSQKTHICGRCHVRVDAAVWEDFRRTHLPASHFSEHPAPVLGHAICVSRLNHYALPACDMRAANLGFPVSHKSDSSSPLSQTDFRCLVDGRRLTEREGNLVTVSTSSRSGNLERTFSPREGLFSQRCSRPSWRIWKHMMKRNPFTIIVIEFRLPCVI